MGGTSIEWTDVTWNPVRGCSRVSEGCRNCYAERQAARFAEPGQPFHGFAKVTAPRDVLDRVGGRRNGWTGRVELIPSKLAEPLHWKRPRRVFVNSMSDLFHEALPDEAIAAVFGVMTACPEHTFQVLTKRPKRMRRWFEWATDSEEGIGIDRIIYAAAHELGDGSEADEDRQVEMLRERADAVANEVRWPLPNVWLGVSVEDQETFDARILPLVSAPAALRFVSYEPALGPLDCSLPVGPNATPLLRPRDPKNGPGCVHWLIVGGESGPGARPCDVAWVRSAVQQCKAAGVPAFVKQLGARPFDFSEVDRFAKVERIPGMIDPRFVLLRDRKGGDPSEWPEDIRVQELPGGAK